MTTRVAITMEYELDSTGTDEAAREVRDLFNQRFKEHNVNNVELDGVFTYRFKPVNGHPFVTTILTGPDVNTIVHAFSLVYNNGFANNDEIEFIRDNFTTSVH